MSLVVWLSLLGCMVVAGCRARTALLLFGLFVDLADVEFRFQVASVVVELKHC